MNREDIIRMALETGLPHWYHTDGIVNEERIIAFANLVASAEREACAKVCDDSWMAFSRTPNRRLDITPFPELEYVAKVIRARGQA